MSQHTAGGAGHVLDHGSEHIHTRARLSDNGDSREYRRCDAADEMGLRVDRVDPRGKRSCGRPSESPQEHSYSGDHGWAGRKPPVHRAYLRRRVRGAAWRGELDIYLDRAVDEYGVGPAVRGREPGRW